MPLHLSGLHLSAPAATATPVQFGSFASSAAPMDVDQPAATAAAAVQFPGAGAAYDPNLLVVQTLVPALIAALQQGLQQQQPQAVIFEGGSHPVPPTLLGPTLPALGSVGLPPAAARSNLGESALSLGMSRDGSHHAPLWDVSLPSGNADSPRFDLAAAGGNPLNPEQARSAQAG